MTSQSSDRDYAAALDEAERMLGFRLERFLVQSTLVMQNQNDEMRNLTAASIHQGNQVK